MKIGILTVFLGALTVALFSFGCADPGGSCSAGSKQCDGTKLNVCYEGSWTMVADCSLSGKICEAGECRTQSGDCTHGETRCSTEVANLLEICNQGQWEDRDNCAIANMICENGACRSSCDAGDTRCHATLADVVETCRYGEYEISENCGLKNQICENGQCKDQAGCTENDTRCSAQSPDLVEVCSGGTWVKGPNCANNDQECVDGSCEDPVACTNDDVRCKTSQPTVVEKCVAGSWSYDADCGLNSQECENGVCVDPVCGCDTDNTCQDACDCDDDCGCTEGERSCKDADTMEFCEDGSFVEEGCTSICQDGLPLTEFSWCAYDEYELDYFCFCGWCGDEYCNTDFENETSCPEDCTPCTNGEFECSTSLEDFLMYCNQGSWEYYQDCWDTDQFCIDLACRDCYNGVKRCDPLGGEVAQECVNNSWVDTNCATNNDICVAGECVSTGCTEGHQRCNNDNVEDCNASGSWVPLTPACQYGCTVLGIEANCNTDPCDGLPNGCSDNGTTRCSGDSTTLEGCQDNGQGCLIWQTIQVCTDLGASYLCDSEGTPQCTDKCSGVLYLCTEAQRNQEYCNTATPASIVKCINDPAYNNCLRWAWQDTCTASEACVTYSATEARCEATIDCDPGEERCSPGGNAQVCDAVNGWETELYCSMDYGCFVDAVNGPRCNDMMACNDISGMYGLVAVGNTIYAMDMEWPSCAWIPGGNDLCFYWYPSIAGVYEISTAGSSFDTVLSIKSAQTGDELACDAYSGPDGTGLIADYFHPDLPVYIIVDGESSIQSGVFNLTIQ